MIRVGIGGWSYAPWKGLFYPKGLKAAGELAYAASKLTLIEINATFYRNQSAKSFARWRDETPEGFVFSVKASRFVSQQKKLDEAGESMERFFASGLAELGDKLGPIVWQLAPWKRFSPDKPEEIDGFLGLLPKKLGARPLRHVIDVRHESWKHADYVALARKHGVATVFTDSDEHPSFADRSADFVYARLMRTRAELESGYPSEELDAWKARFEGWSRGTPPADLPRAGTVSDEPAPGRPLDMFVLFISGAKERAPAAAEALLARLGPAKK
jgi:uncharacterized protein YecE (DUF72 family)